MKIIRLLFGVTAAFVGAGFASGREIMQFFSRYGFFSYPLIAFVSVVLGLLTRKMLESDIFQMEGAGPIPGTLKRTLLFLLYAGTAGAMTAAAGELAALTAPLFHARTLGMVLTLVLCFYFSRRSLTALQSMGYLLLPLTAAALLLCGRVPPDGEEQFLEPVGRPLAGVLLGACYGAMNVMLSAGVLREAGKQCGPRERRWTALGVGAVASLMLLLGNGALLPHRRTLLHAALPTVILLGRYGKGGYYLAAGFLYLAVASTLTAVLQSLRETISFRKKALVFPFTFLAVMTVAACGFEEIVEKAYPFCGFLCLLFILSAKKSEGSPPSP